MRNRYICIFLYLFILCFQAESRKKFKTYVNVLSTIKSDGSEKFLVLRKKFHHVCPTEEGIENERPECTSDPKQVELKPPPYKLPPMMMTQSNENFKLCVDEFKHALNIADSANDTKNLTGIFDATLGTSTDQEEAHNLATRKENDYNEYSADDTAQGNVISVREATRKFNRIASQEDAKPMGSPSSVKPNSEKTVSFRINIRKYSFEIL